MYYAGMLGFAFLRRGNPAGGFPQSNSRQQGGYQNSPANWSGSGRQAPQVDRKKSTVEYVLGQSTVCILAV